MNTTILYIFGAITQLFIFGVMYAYLSEAKKKAKKNNWPTVILQFILWCAIGAFVWTSPLNGPRKDACNFLNYSEMMDCNREVENTEKQTDTFVYYFTLFLVPTLIGVYQGVKVKDKK